VTERESKDPEDRSRPMPLRSIFTINRRGGLGQTTAEIKSFGGARL